MRLASKLLTATLLIPGLLAFSIYAFVSSNSVSPLGTNMGSITNGAPGSPFLNMLKIGSGWGGTLASGTPCPGGNRCNEIDAAFQLDSNGYVTSFSGTGVAAGFTFSEIDFTIISLFGGSQNPLVNNGTIPAYAAGYYLLRWSGTGNTVTISDNGGGHSNTCTSSPCAVNLSAPSTSGIKIQISALGSGSNYFQGASLVYCSTYTSNVCGTGYDALLDGGEIFDPRYIANMKIFRTVRCMDWMQTNQSPITTWAQRPIMTQAFWGISSKVGSVDPMGNGVPLEACIALANELRANIHVNMPFLSTSDYVTNAADYTLANLNSKLSVVVEYGNEVWNCSFNDACGSAMQAQVQAAGKALYPGWDTAGGAGFYYGLYESVVDGAIWKHEWGVQASRIHTTIGGQGGAFSGTCGLNTYAMLFKSTGAVGSPCNISSMGGPSTFGTNAANPMGTVAQNNDKFLTSFYWGNTYPQAWTGFSDGGLTRLFQEFMSGGLPDGSSKTTTAGGPGAYTVSAGAGTVSNGEVIAVSFNAPSSGSATFTSGNPSIAWTSNQLVAGEWVSCHSSCPTGITTDQMYLVISTGLTANAFEMINAALNSGASYNSSTGVVQINLHQSLIGLTNGSSVTVAGITGTGSVSSLNGSFTAGSGTNSNTLFYTISTGLTLTALQTGNVQFGPAVSSSANGIATMFNLSPTMTANDGGTYPITDEYGNPLFNGPGVCSSSCFNSFTNYALVFTNANAQGTVTPAWRLQAYTGYATGWAQQEIDQKTADLAGVATYGIGTLPGGRSVTLYEYEFGQNLLLPWSGNTLGGNDPNYTQLNINAQYDGRMEAVYDKALLGWFAAGGTDVNHFTEVGNYTQFGFFGSMENYVTQGSSTPRYITLLDFISQHPCTSLGWTGCTLNFILNRDLNPTSNDNTPVWINRAA